MKKLSLAFVALFMASISFAQKGLEFGFHVTPTNTWIINDEDFAEGDNLDFRATFKYNLGATLGFNLTESFGLATGLIFTQQGQNYRTGYDNRQAADQDRFDRQLSYLRIPILLRYSSPEGGGFFRVGPHIDLLQSATYNYERRAGLLPPNINDMDLTNQSNLLTGQAYEIYRKTAIGVTMELGGRININEAMFVPITLHLSGTFNPEGKDAGRFFPSTGFPNYNRSTAYNAAIGLSIGFHYVIGAN